MTFSEGFCAKYHVRPEAYEAEVMKRSLYPAARVVRGFLALIPDYFSADRAFLNAVGRMTRRRDFGLEEIEFVHHPANRGFLRRQLKLRVSARRLHRLVRAVFNDEQGGPDVAGESLAPWPKRGGG